MARRLSMATRKELTSALAQRYDGANRIERSRILDEFVGLTGLHRKHAMRLLRGNGQVPARRVRRRVYEEAERNALLLLWEAGDRVCGKRKTSKGPPADLARLDGMPARRRFGEEAGRCTIRPAPRPASSTPLAWKQNR